MYLSSQSRWDDTTKCCTLVAQITENMIFSIIKIRDTARLTSDKVFSSPVVTVCLQGEERDTKCSGIQYKGTNPAER